MLPALAILAMLMVPTLGHSLEGRLPYIVNGKDVDFPGKYPFMASYQRLQSHWCGAAIINEKYLLTAAHCCSGPGAPSDYTMVVGAHDIKTRKQGDPTTYNLASIKINPGYGKGSGLVEADICLITLASNINMTNRFVGIIDLPAVGSTDLFVGEKCTIMGWGLTKMEITAMPNILQEANETVLSLAACKTEAAKIPGRKESDVVASHICVKSEGTDKSGACHSDSGGPLACPSSSGGRVLAGVLSWGDPWCDPKYPDMYTRITSFRDWIKNNTGI